MHPILANTLEALADNALTTEHVRRLEALIHNLLFLHTDEDVIDDAEYLLNDIRERCPELCR